MIVVNKADIDAKAAERAARVYRDALHILEPASSNWSPPVLTASGLEGAGVDRIWASIEDHRTALARSGERATRRADQQVRWMKSLIDDALGAAFRDHPAVRAALPALEAAVAAGRTPASVAADEAIALFR
jgi:LAO/AO transport system kinase